LKKLYEESLFWLGIYLVLNIVTGNIAGVMGIENHLVSAIPNLILAVICYLYLKRTGKAEHIGLFTRSTEKPSVMLYYLPLLILPFLNLTYGFNTSLSITEIAILLVMYIGVGFMEEVIFRGLMFKELVAKWNRYIVVAFISFTFAIGHIISMVAIGQSSADTVLQIVNAFVVGIMFMVVILASGNLTICIFAHILYNFVANISMVNSTHTEIIVLNTIITALYTAYLIFRGGNIRLYFSSSKSLVKV
jgi:uncharacterized protein